MIILYAIIFICILSTNGNVALGTANESIRSLPIFQPSILDFGETPICIPSYSEFEIINRVKNKLEILSVETSSAFFLPITQNLTVDSFETASLQVVFLPYGLGSVEATLNVVTSFGNLTYYLKGFGKNNQYDIKPIFLEDAVGEIFNEQSITLFNPHDENINILEIFTTEPFINLVFENQSTLWTISPRMAKQVISFSISTEISSNQKGFVYIHTDLDKIVVPVVVDFNMNKLSLVKALEFGLVLATTEKKSIDLVVVNDARRSILLHGIRTYPPDPNMKIDMISKYTLIPTATIMKIATLTYTSTYSGKFNGSVVIFTNESKHFGAKDVFTYRGEVYTGSVSFDRSQTVFPIGFSNPDRNFPTIKRKISFKNLFPIPFKITNVGLTNCIGMFQLRENIVGVFLNTNESSASVQISLIPTALEAVYNHQRDFLPKTCWLEVSTNISSQRIPLHIMKGNLIFDFLEGVSSLLLLN